MHCRAADPIEATAYSFRNEYASSPRRDAHNSSPIHVHIPIPGRVEVRPWRAEDAAAKCEQTTYACYCVHSSLKGCPDKIIAFVWGFRRYLTRGWAASGAS